ncbi:hypothetical protein N8672_02955, partial [Akkermansiaceae bacterium]|nr:hypothetical protein [Akkermansiaceae bacterium]
AQADLNDGLVAYYPFNGNANDESGNGNNGVVNGATLTNDRSGEENSAYSFDGNDLIDMGNPEVLKLTGDFTISTWALFYSNQGTDRILSYNQEFGFEIGLWDRRPWFAYALTNHVASKPVEPNTWFNLTVTKAGDTIRFYVNGQRAVEEKNDGIPTFDRRFEFGRKSQQDGSWNGEIDETRFYNRSFTQGEVNALFNGGPQFQIIEGNFTWQEAKADAEAKGGQLAVLDTQDKIDAANTYLEDLEEWPLLWMGASDAAAEGNWVWITGEPVTTSNWGSNEGQRRTSNGRGEDYAAIFHNNPSGEANAAEWSDWTNGGGSSQGGSTGSYLLEILVQEPAAPVVELDPFYESNPLEEIVVDATPTEGFPDNFTYQWSFDDFEVPAFLGGAEATLSLLGTSDQNGTWKVVVSNSVGSTEASFEYRMFEDNDADGISNYREENITLTNPDNADSDSDGLLDPEELFIHETDPNIADVDEDGLNDSEEIDAATDPRVADSDSDGLSDGLEVKTYSSNPNKADTDGDGIADAAEVAAGLDINAAENIADAVAFLIQELANRPPVDGFEDAIAEARASGRNDVTSAPSQYDLYEKEAYNAVVAERDARPTLAQYSEVLVERDARPSVVAYNAVIADRDSRPTKEAYDTVVSERDARPTLEEVKDGRLGSVLLLPDTATNKVRLRFCIEESNGLGQWITREEEAEVDVPLAPGKKFFRFSVKENE